MPFWFYFILTLLIELPIVAFFFWREWKFALLAGLLLNLFTWPLLQVILANTPINVNLLEICVAIVEGLGYWLLIKCPLRKAMIVGFIANATSYLLGLLLNYYT